MTTQQKMQERERQYFATQMTTKRDPATGRTLVFYQGRRIGHFKNYLQAREQAPAAIQQMFQADKAGQSRAQKVRTTAMTSGRALNNVRTR
jgi:Tfp pilus assembly protein PilE